MMLTCQNFSDILFTLVGRARTKILKRDTPLFAKYLEWMQLIRFHTFRVKWAKFTEKQQFLKRSPITSNPKWVELRGASTKLIIRKNPAAIQGRASIAGIVVFVFVSHATSILRCDLLMFHLIQFVLTVFDSTSLTTLFFTSGTTAFSTSASSTWILLATTSNTAASTTRTAIFTLPRSDLMLKSLSVPSARLSITEIFFSSYFPVLRFLFALRVWMEGNIFFWRYLDNFSTDSN